MSKRNNPIGTVECPTKGCSEQCNVYRFRERGESEKSVANRRFAGKLYARCSKHGTFGGSAGDADMQEYILCHAKMHGAGDRQSTPATSPATSSNQTLAASTPRSAARSSGPSRPASSAPAKPSASSPATTSETPANPKRSGWGFFE